MEHQIYLNASYDNLAIGVLTELSVNVKNLNMCFVIIENAMELELPYDIQSSQSQQMIFLPMLALLFFFSSIVVIGLFLLR